MPSLNLLIVGRQSPPPPLPGPLCQLGLGRDGTFFVVAAGRANHAGRGKHTGIADGNKNSIGIEAENVGTAADPWPAVQLNAYHRGAAAILKKIGEDESMCIGHKEWTPRKIDPHTLDMKDFRAEVKKFMTGAAPPPVMIPSVDAKGRPTLRRGAKGDLVTQIQKKLGVSAVGNFGPQTEAAVRSMQSAHGLVPDGIVGPKTWAVLDTL